MIEKLRKNFHWTAEALEVLMSVFVFAAIVVGIIGLVPVFREFWFHRNSAHALLDVLESILTIVVASEFISLLCSPSADNVAEVLIFLIARHMIVKEANGLEIFLTVLSIAVLFVLRNYLKKTREGKEFTLFPGKKEE